MRRWIVVMTISDTGRDPTVQGDQFTPLYVLDSAQRVRNHIKRNLRLDDGMELEINHIDEIIP